MSRPSSIAGTEWSPVLNAVAICITMQSMLASNKKKERWVDGSTQERTLMLDLKEMTATSERHPPTLSSLGGLMMTM